jgi:hypothetical protein
MFDKNSYLEDKIFQKLKSSKKITANDYPVISRLIEQMGDNLDVLYKHGPTFEESVISYVKFCEILEKIFELDLPLDLHSVKKIYSTQSESLQTKRHVRPSIELYEERPPESEEDKVKRLLELSEETDIIDSYDADNLTENGLRALGLISDDETSLDAVSVVPVIKMPVVKLENRDDVIISPFTNSHNVFQVDSNTWMDIDTEEQFKVFYECDSPL